MDASGYRAIVHYFIGAVKCFTRLIGICVLASHSCRDRTANAGIAFGRIKFRDRSTPPVGRNDETIARKVIDDGLGRNGDCRDRRLVLLYPARGLAYCELVF
jgi:hypothetical protein